MRRKSQLALVLATLLSVMTLAVVPVAAEDGGSSGSSGSSDNTATTDTATSADSNDAAEVETEVNDIKGQAQRLLETERKSVSEHSQLARQNACKAHQAEINRRAANYATAAQRHLDTFTSILTKVQNFYKNKNLNVATYPTLLTTALAKQTAAQQAVDVLKSLDTTIDCSQPDPAQNVQALKMAVTNARTALQAYRGAIKDVIVALEGASSANASTGGNQ